MNNVALTDEAWMREALCYARQAGEQGEVPVGAVVVKDDKLLSFGWNQPVGSQDPTAHAEVCALRRACDAVGNYRIPGATLYVTLEPCVMCLGAMVHARVSRLVFGAVEPKAGAVLSQARLLQDHPFNWTIEVESGVLGKECSQVISEFFARRRAQQKLQKK